MKTVIVMGAPRSGTSMTAGILSQLGVAMGRIRSADALNPTGYFEDWDFLALADEVFTTAKPGAHGFNLPSPEQLQQVKGAFDQRINLLVNERTRQCTGSMWGWKATGTTLFIDDLLPIVPNPHVIIVLRNPVMTARSAIRYVQHKDKKDLYQDISLTDALRVVRRYEASIYDFIEQHAYNLPCRVLAYEDMLANPQYTVQSMQSFLNVTTSKRVTRDIVHFISARGTTAKPTLAERLSNKTRRAIRRRHAARVD